MITEPLFKVNRNRFLGDNKDFINTVTEKILGKRLYLKKDEKYKTAEAAFDESCDTYQESMGNFFCYAEALIKNSVINHCREAGDKYKFSFGTEEGSGITSEEKYKSDQFQLYAENSERAEEIRLLNKELSIFDYSIQSITDSCPENTDSRNRLLNTAVFCSADKAIISYIYENGHLPVKEIMELTNANKKLIEKYEGYLILLIILFSSDEYLYIKSFLNIKVEEKDGQERISNEG